MCGIVGIFNLSSSEAVCGAALRRAVDSLRHRGPNAQVSNVLSPTVGLGHARLSILDLSSHANQPFSLDDGSLTIVFNGEIFNYVELKSELQSRGHRFQTTSDTEVLLHAYAEWGPGVTSRLNGMWAFAIYDRERDALFCSRDRFGIKPFNYTLAKGRFCFASEVKALLELDPDLAAPNFDALSLLMREGLGAQLEDTCFRSIKRLRPAHNLYVTRGGVRLERYWDYPASVEHNASPELAAEELRELLTDAIRIRMRSDVPVGSTVSSGLDSSSIVCLLRSFFDGPHDAYTADFGQNARVNEAPAAARLAESLGMTPHLVPAYSGELLPRLRQIVYHLESPHTSPAILPLWNIMAEAKKTVVVLLEGQGADEELGGYIESVFGYSLLGRLTQGDLLQGARELAQYARHRSLRNAAMLTVRHGTPAWVNTVFRSLRGDEAAYDGPLRRRVERPRFHDADKTAHVDLLTRLLRRQHEGGLVNLLHYGDAISMAHSIESRLPFLDYRLVEYCFRLPGRIKVRDGWGKRVLRDAVKGIVPDEIAYSRDKLGFTTPIAQWFRDHPQDTIDPVLRSEAFRNRGLFKPTVVDRVIADHVAGRKDMSSVLFRWICTELWFQTFMHGQADRAGAASAA